MYRSLALAACISIASLGDVFAEAITAFEMTPNKSDYPCFLELQTDQKKHVVFQLSDYKDLWSINIAVSDRADVYQKFFDENQLRDEDKFNQTFTHVKFGGKKIDFNEVTLLEVLRKDINEKTTAFFTIQEKHNVVAALEAMTEEGIEIPSLVSLTNTVDATESYRTCAYDAIGVSSGEAVEYDSTAEFRMIFEKSFDTWIASMSRADACMQARFEDDEVEDIINQATDAFYPGLLNMMKRRDYADELNAKVPLSKLSGFSDANSKGCMMARSLADMSKITVEKAIEAAQE